MDESLDFKKQKIHDFIARNPGANISKISEMLHISVNVVEQNLVEMETLRIIIIKEENGYKQYYLDNSKKGVFSKKITEIRQHIFFFVTENPGMYLSEIAEKLHMRVSHIEYHLSYMEKIGSIIVNKEEGYKRYYVKGSEIGVVDRKTLGLLRQEMPLKIILLLLKHKTLQHKELKKFFNIAPSTLSYHLTKLAKDGIIDFCTYGENKGYSIQDRKSVIEFLTKYKLNKMTESFGDMWSDLNYSR